MAVKVSKPFYTGINVCNSLPNDIKKIKNEDIFKEKVKTYLMMEFKNVEMEIFTKEEIGLCNYSINILVFMAFVYGWNLKEPNENTLCLLVSSLPIVLSSYAVFVKGP